MSQERQNQSESGKALGLVSVTGCYCLSAVCVCLLVNRIFFKVVVGLQKIEQLIEFSYAPSLPSPVSPITTILHLCCMFVTISEPTDALL